MRVSVYRYVFVSAPGSYEMGRHKQSIIITIKHVCDSLLWEKKRRDINKRPEHTFCARTYVFINISIHHNRFRLIPVMPRVLGEQKGFLFQNQLPVGDMFFCAYRFICCHTPLVCLSLYLLPHASRVFIAILVAKRLSCDYSFTCCHKTLLCLSQYLLPHASCVIIALLVATRLSCVYRYTCCHTPLV